jgi:redox-sensitive bicupin YhaK (pirin superfamily)
MEILTYPIEGALEHRDSEGSASTLRPGIVVPVASRGGRAGGLDIHQDVTITAALLGAGDEILQPLSPGRHLWMQVVAGSGTALGLDLEAGDGLAVANETAVVLRSDTGMEVLTFDLA